MCSLTVPVQLQPASVQAAKLSQSAALPGPDTHSVLPWRVLSMALSRTEPALRCGLGPKVSTIISIPATTSPPRAQAELGSNNPGNQQPGSRKLQVVAGLVR